MKGIGKAAVAVGVGAGVTALRQVVANRRGGESRQPSTTSNRWLAVTVNCSPQQVASPNGLPVPLVELGDLIEVRIRPASGDKGTELAARLRDPAPSGMVTRAAGEDPTHHVRLALREAKSLLETGDVIHSDTPHSTHPGPGGWLVRAATRLAKGEGRL